MSAAVYTELREIPLARITVPEDFNPRGAVVDDAELEALAETIRARGVLQPILVRTHDGEDFILIAGERRYRAALKAGLAQIPATVRLPGDPLTKDEPDLAADAVIENELRKPLDPVQRATGYGQMMRGGLPAKGVAERLGGKIPVARIRDTLAILDLPENVHPKIADGTVPLRAVKPLVALTKIHAELPAVAIGRVINPPAHSWDAPTTWDDLVADPIDVVIGRYGADALPPGVYAASVEYPACAFDLPDDAAPELAELCELIDEPAPQEFPVRFGSAAREQALALKAAHVTKSGHDALIVGPDVASQLAADYIRRCLTVQRENAARAKAAAQRAAGSGATSGGGAADLDARRAQRQADKERRAAAHARNEILGTALVKHLSKVKVDERVLRILTASPLSSNLREIATRGARYGFPGWVTMPDDGRKPVFLSPADAEAKAREYLAGAKSAPDVAGRAIALLAMAAHADEDAVAQSYRSRYALRFDGYGSDSHGVPWRTEVPQLLDDLLVERLPDEAAALVRGAREQEAA